MIPAGRHRLHGHVTHLRDTSRERSLHELTHHSAPNPEGALVDSGGGAEMELIHIPKTAVSHLQPLFPQTVLRNEWIPFFSPDTYVPLTIQLQFYMDNKVTRPDWPSQSPTSSQQKTHGQVAEPLLPGPNTTNITLIELNKVNMKQHVQNCVFVMCAKCWWLDNKMKTCWWKGCEVKLNNTRCLHPRVNLHC